MFVLVPSSEEVRRLDLRGWGFYISLCIVKLLFKETEVICIPTKQAESAHIKGWEYNSGGRVFASHAHSPGFNPQPLGGGGKRIRFKAILCYVVSSSLAWATVIPCLRDTYPLLPKNRRMREEASKQACQDTSGGVQRCLTGLDLNQYLIFFGGILGHSPSPGFLI